MVTEPETPIFSLLEPSGPTRHIELIEGTKSFVACEKYTQGQDWLMNRHGKQYKTAPWKKALLIWLGTPPELKGFSRTNHSLLSWLNGLDNAANKKIKKALKKPECMIIFGFDVGDGAAFAAVTVKPSNTKLKSKGKKQAIKASLVDNGQPKFFEVKRVDHSWLHGRDHDAQSQSLKHKTVVLVGCGSVGGSVAHLLAEAGVGSIHCIDPGIMEWGNIGRHVLGSDSIGKIKSGRVVRQLQTRFPHLQFKSYGTSSWQQVYDANPQVFNNADLIVSTTGAWAVDAQLNELSLSTKEMPSVLYGWTEAHAVAGHAVLIPNEKACLACNFNNTGVHNNQTVDWGKKNTLKREAACGTFFQPFGPIELSFINALIADTALTEMLGASKNAICSSWLASRKKVEALGGKWSDNWVNKFGDPGEGGFQIQKDWEQNAKCHVCGKVVGDSESG